MCDVIAFTGPAGAGKSTAARTLVANGWTLVKFADPLKGALRAIYAAAGLEPEDIEDRIEGHRKELPDPVLGGASPRYAMQTLGAEWGRDLILESLWVELWGRRVRKILEAGGRVVTDDCRYDNEAGAVCELGGVVLRVEGRGGIETDHSSECGAPADLILSNAGTLEELEARVLALDIYTGVAA